MKMNAKELQEIQKMLLRTGFEPEKIKRTENGLLIKVKGCATPVAISNDELRQCGYVL